MITTMLRENTYNVRVLSVRMCILPKKSISVHVERLPNVTEELIKASILEPFQFATRQS